MDVDLPTDRIEQHDARRQLALRHFVALLAKRLDEQRHIGSGHDEIQVVVLSRLLAEQRVHAPATVEPDLDPRRHGEEPDDVFGAHGQARLPFVVDRPLHAGVH